jgi:hypothetical protein
MKLSRLSAYALGLGAAAALMAGCTSNGGSAFGVPSGMSSLNQLVSGAPDNHKKEPLTQYMSVSNAILEYDYPKGDQSIGQIPVGSGAGECADVLYGAAKRDFWMAVPATDEYDEFAVGGTKPIKTLTESAGEPSGNCAMDPTTGNLAAPLFSNGDVVIFENASGSGAAMTTPLFEAYFAGFDNDGNLFVDGRNTSLAFGLVELPKGSSAFQTITTSNTVQFPGAVQWDGKYVTVGDQESAAIYRYAVSGTTATLKGTVSLTGAGDCGQTWIGSSGRVFCPDSDKTQGEVYKYPAGGSPVAILTTNGYGPGGIVEVRK